ncbi:hypothetical protein V2J23_17445, partial [Geobacillus thermoleovorans]
GHFQYTRTDQERIPHSPSGGDFHGKVYYDPWYGSYVYYYNGLAIAVTKDKIITTIYWGKPKKKMDKNKITRLEGRSLKNVVITKEPIK